MHHTIRTTFLVFVGLTTILATEDYKRRMPSRFEFARSQSEANLTDADPRVVYWIPTPCDSMFERGYTCYSCGEAMHCMLGNVGLLALCYGRRPYCNNGVCSDIPTQKCKAEHELHLNATQSIHTATNTQN